MNEAAEEELYNRLEKTAANPMNFIKNLSGHNVRQAEKALKTGLESTGTRTGIKELRKGVKNAKADKNLARLGTAAGVTAAGAGLGGIKAYQSSNYPGGDQQLNQQYGYYNQPNEQMQQLAHQQLVERLEKTANTSLQNQYPSYTSTQPTFQKTAEEENPRQDRTFLTEALLGVGPAAHFAKKNNQLGVNPEDSHAVANAKLSAIQSGIGGALGGAAIGATGRSGAMRIPAAALGGVAGAAGGALYGGGMGAGVGYLHDQWDKNHPVEDEEQLASQELFNRLEKTAEENQRQDRKFLTEYMVGGGPVGYVAKKYNTLGVNPEDSHAVANAKAQGLTMGASTGLMGAGLGAALKPGKRLPAAALGGVAGALGGSLYGAGAGAGMGYFHDQWDKKHPVEQEQLASQELMHRLEKSAAGIKGAWDSVKNVGVKTKDKSKDVFNTTTSSLKGYGQKVKGQSKNYIDDVSGKNYRNKKNGIIAETESGPMKAGSDEVKKARNDMFKAQAIGAGALAGAAGTAGVLNNRKKEEKTASEEVLSGLYKEAASAILNESLPPVRKHVDPMKKIAFSR